MADSTVLSRLSPSERAVWDDYQRAHEAIKRESDERLATATTDAECLKVVAWVAEEMDLLLERFRLLLAIVRAERPEDG